MIAISDNVQVRKDVPSGTILLNRPNRRNALSQEVVKLLLEAFEDFQQERSVRAVILTGTGNTFCSGTDLQELQDIAAQPDAMEAWQADTRQFLELIEYMLRFPKPIIAAVNGWIVGSGAALMLAADVVIAGTSARILMPESKRGLISGIAAPLLAFRVGTGPAANILLSGNTIDANQALKLSLFHETVEDDFVWARSQELCKQFAMGAIQSHQLTKRLLNETIGEQLFTQLSIGAANTAAARTTDAAVEGIAAFLEKREPNW